MPNYAKHEGKLTSDGNGVVILYGMIEAKNPLANGEDYDNCLVYVMGSTPPAFETPLLQYVRSTEGQNARDVGDVLNKYTLGNDSRSILQTLRATNKIKKVPVDQVMVVLNSTLAFPLRNWVEINRPRNTENVVINEPSKVEQPSTVDINAFNEQLDVEDENKHSDTDEVSNEITESKEELKEMIDLMEEELKRLKEKYNKVA